MSFGTSVNKCPRLAYQRPTYVLSSVQESADKIALAANEKHAAFCLTY